MTLADLLIRYQYGNLASQVKGNSQIGALEKNYLSMGGDLDDGDHLSAMSDEKHRQLAAGVYAEKYQEIFDNTPISDLFDYYDHSNSEFRLSSYFSPQEIRLLKIKLSPHFNKTLKEIKEDIKANYGTLKRAAGAHGSGVPEAEILGADYSNLHYDELLKIISQFEQIKNATLEIKAISVGKDGKIKNLKKGLMEPILGVDPSTKNLRERLREQIYSENN